MGKAPTPVPVPAPTSAPEAQVAEVIQPMPDTEPTSPQALEQTNPDEATVPARILVDHLEFRAGSYALLTEAQATDCAAWADTHPDAAAYAKAEAEGAA